MSLWRAPSRRSQGDAGRIDLSEDSEFLLALIDRPLQWRERVVEELTLEAGAHVRVATSYQIDLPPDLVRRFADPEIHRCANVLLPLTTRPKKPLLHLDISGPGGAPAHLLPRVSVAALEAEYLARLIATSPVGDGVCAGLPDSLLEAICVFTPGYFESLGEDGKTRDAQMADYLSSGLGEGFDVTEDRVHEWRESTREAKAILESHGRWLPPGTSSSEEVLLAVPRMDPLPSSFEEIDALLRRFDDAVKTASGAGDDVLLKALAEYGRRFELIVEVEIPLLEPSTVKVNEDRALGRRRCGWVTQDFRLGDARSAHLEARVVDPSVEIADFEVRDLQRRPVALGPLELVRRTDEALALYSSEEERPDYACVSLRLKPRRYVRWTSTALTSLNVVAATAALAMPRDALLVERLALLTIPTTLAATFVLVREQTALASWLQGAARVWLGMSTATLWTIVLLLAVTFHPPVSGHFSSSSGRSGMEPTPTRPTGRLEGERKPMARNGARGNGRVGAVKGRTQTRNPKTGLWTKRDGSTGRFLDVKKSGGTFKGVRREK